MTGAAQSTERSLDRVRTDQVGSLLRPAGLKAQRARFDRHEISADAYRAVEDQAIREVLEKQDAHDVAVATDGEFRRLNFQDSFASSVTGYVVDSTATAAFHASRSRGGAPGQRWDPGYAGSGPGVIHRRPVRERLVVERNVPLEEFSFAQGLTTRPVKVSLIGPDRITQRFAWEDPRSKQVYPDRWEFLDDVVRLEREMVTALVDAGCRYVHLDEPGLTAYVDEQSLAEMRARGEDVQTNLEHAIAALNRLMDGFSGVTFGVHICRGNQAGMWHREGSYDAIAERVFAELRCQRLLLEYDTQRAGGFEPLRFVPRDRVVVLGLVSTKSPRLETADELLRRIDDAAEYVPVDQLALSPQCGFASDIVGNPLSEDDQWRKLDRVQEVAHLMWGS